MGSIYTFGILVWAGLSVKIVCSKEKILGGETKILGGRMKM